MDKIVLFIVKHGKCKEFNPYAEIKFYYFKYILKKNKQLLTIKYNNDSNISRESLIKLVLETKLRMYTHHYDLIYWRRYKNYPIYAVQINDSFPLNEEILKEINEEMFLKTTIFPLFNKMNSVVDEIKKHCSEKLLLKNDSNLRLEIFCGDILIFIKKIYLDNINEL